MSKRNEEVSISDSPGKCQGDTKLKLIRGISCKGKIVRISRMCIYIHFY